MSKPARVVLADANPASLSDTADLLHRSGYDCQGVIDSMRCERELRRGNVDVLVADIRMPGNTNLELVSRVRSMRRPPAVILMTGFPTLETAIQAIKLKIDAYLVKPFGFNELLSEIRQALLARNTTLNPSNLQFTDRLQGHVETSLDLPFSTPEAQTLLETRAEVQRLTPRELDVMTRVLTGDDIPTIGRALFISAHTVRNHLKSIYRKLGVRTRVELIVRFGPLRDSQTNISTITNS